MTATLTHYDFNAADTTVRQLNGSTELMQNLAIERLRETTSGLREEAHYFGSESGLNLTALRANMEQGVNEILHLLDIIEVCEERLIQQELDAQAFAIEQEQQLSDEAWMVEAGHRLRTAREQKGMKQGAFAKKLKTTQATISRMEHGRYTVGSPKWEQAAAKLGVELPARY